MSSAQIEPSGAGTASQRPVHTTSPPTRPQSHVEYLAMLDERAWSLIESSMSAETLRAYRHDWDHFQDWCAHFGFEPLPASSETVKLYLAELAEGYRPATIQRRLAAIALAHRTADLPSPTEHHEVRATHSGIRRHLKVAPKSAKPLRFEELVRVLKAMPEGELKTARDGALLLVGFYGGLRRSEIVALDVDDIEFVDRGLLVTLRSGKTDQDGAGRTIGIPDDSHTLTSAPRALRNWLRESVIEAGPVFRPINRHGHLSDQRLAPQGVWTVIKSRVQAAGLDPDDYSAHSLRSGLATSAAEAGASERSIMNQTGHRSERVVRGYIQRATVFDDNPVASILREHRRSDEGDPPVQGSPEPSPDISDALEEDEADGFALWATEGPQHSEELDLEAIWPEFRQRNDAAIRLKEELESQLQADGRSTTDAGAG